MDRQTALLFCSILENSGLPGVLAVAALWGGLEEPLPLCQGRCYPMMTLCPNCTMRRLRDAGRPALVCQGPDARYWEALALCAVRAPEGFTQLLDHLSERAMFGGASAEARAADGFMTACRVLRPALGAWIEDEAPSPEGG